ncbi:class I SAM-dependent methyltransferase [Phaeodactylibacter luteus]|uniref:SAM-dependent methyltransferase n=1 Tax=Phaeodactylibacter luteus TaxID=1564516 RepID=A0A5C6RKI7_9BACT|nr:SAM-dependent methyltransferase [Phaeodactylibacter luteus]TXB62866.1 SAM-dependent methyltransferase [Phaeodactylibacter luteus]
MDPKAQFLAQFRQSIADGHFIKLTLSKAGGEDKEFKNVYARLITLKGEPHLSFTLRYATRDITKNHPPQEAEAMLGLWLGQDFLHGVLFTRDTDITLQYNRKRKPRLFSAKASLHEAPAQNHDQAKQYLIAAEGSPYLQAMGIASSTGKIKADGQRKFRQINKYIEIFDTLLSQAKSLPNDPHIVDMGAGKGYLTFALYDHLVNNRRLRPVITGIELRENLVVFGNELAAKAGYESLSFRAQDIFDFRPERIDVLIALHACDIATDIAIAKGVQAGAEIIVVAPCCHKQVRKAMAPPEELQPVLRHGILLERQAELLTDGIRALVMEANGYETKVFEFISTEHTSKNLMIVGVKGKANEKAMAEIAQLKARFGISEHYLETLLRQHAKVD